MKKKPDNPREFETVFTNVIEEFEFRARGGDAVSPWIRVELVETPAVNALKLEVTPPKYTGEKVVELPSGKGPYFVLKGSTLKLSGTANKELAEATPVVEAMAFESDTSFATVANDGDGRASSPTTAAPAGAGIDAGLAELFEEFRAAEEGDSEHEDFETHYNMGTAYKEMDLMDEAVQEFQTAANLVKPGDGTSRFLQCCNMLGHCFMQKGMPEAAVIWFKKGLSAPGHTEDEYQALRYELASAYEQLGDLKSAREFYTAVYGVDVSYREVADKLSQLKNK